MKRLLLASLLCGFAFAASAQSVTISAETGAEATLVQPETDAPFNERLCLRQTGSRIVASDTHHGTANVAVDTPGRRCVNANGRAYTREDIDRLGAFDLAETIRRLDTAVR